MCSIYDAGLFWKLGAEFWRPVAPNTRPSCFQATATRIAFQMKGQSRTRDRHRALSLSYEPRTARAGLTVR